MSGDEDVLTLCPGCGQDPYQYIFDGESFRPVAVICCADAIRSMYQHLDDEDDNILRIQALDPPPAPDVESGEEPPEQSP